MQCIASEVSLKLQDLHNGKKKERKKREVSELCSFNLTFASILCIDSSCLCSSLMMRFISLHAFFDAPSSAVADTGEGRGVVLGVL